MKADELLRQYEKVADAPNAIARLRRFILDLAVRGKLVPQDAGDAPAITLLHEIDAKRAEVDASRRAKIDRSQVDVSDVPFELPRTWVWTRLGRLTSYIQRGKSPKYADAGGSPVVSQKCVQWNGLDLSAARMVTMESLADYDEVRFLRDGDLLWNSTGTGTIGRVIRLIQPPIRLVCDSHVTVVRCLGVVPEYVRTWLRSDHVYGSIEGRAAGSTNQVELTGQMAISQLVPLPPLAEQRRIVAKVDELMALCDRLEAARAEREAARNRLTAASLVRLNTPDPETFSDDARFAFDTFRELTARSDQVALIRQAVLNLALRGQLVKIDAADGSGLDALAQVAAERDELVAQGAIRREAPLAPIQDADVPFELPRGWSWVRIGSAVLFTQYGTSQKAAASASGVPVLTMGNIQSGTVVPDSPKRIPEESEELPALYLKKFDLLYNRTNSAELVGKTGIFLGQDDTATFASYLIRLRPSVVATDPHFLNLAMNTSDFRTTQIVPLIKKQTGQANVNGSALKNMLIPMPSLAIQKRIVSKVAELMSLCDRIERSLIDTADRRTRLLEALLHHALKPMEVMETVE
jgi:type I restriction enzyme S subunit